MITFNGSDFTWKRSNNSGSSMASDLGIVAGAEWPEQFYIKSHKTGQVKLFLPDSPIFNGHGEDREFVGASYFVPGGDLTVTIWND